MTLVAGDAGPMDDQPRIVPFAPQRRFAVNYPETLQLRGGDERSRIPAADPLSADPLGGIHGCCLTGGAKVAVRDIPELSSFQRVAARVMVGRRPDQCGLRVDSADRKSTRLNSSHL